MGFDVGRIDHRLIGLAALGLQLGEDRTEDDKAAAADETIVSRLVRAVLFWRIAPAQPVPDNEDDAADDPPVIGRGIPCEKGKHGEMRRICAGESQIRSLTTAPPGPVSESNDQQIRKMFNRS